MGDISHNLDRTEFACRCGCGFDTVDFELARILQDCVDHFRQVYPELDVRIHINSGCRCPAHNESVGGSPKSEHVRGRAADFYIYDGETKDRIHEDEVANHLCSRYTNQYGIGRYVGRTHLDTRKTMARWDKR